VGFLINTFMLKSLISGIGAILVLLILMWILLNPQKKWNWSKYTPVRIVALIITIVLFSATYVSYNWGINKGVKKTEILSILRNVSNYKTKSLMLFFESNDNNFKDTIIIKNDTIIEKFSQALSRFEPFYPNHPLPLWHVNLKIFLENRQLDDIRLDFVKDKIDSSLFFDIIRDTKMMGSFYMGAYLNNDLDNLLKKYYFENNKIMD